MKGFISLVLLLAFMFIGNESIQAQTSTCKPASCEKIIECCKATVANAANAQEAAAKLADCAKRCNIPASCIAEVAKTGKCSPAAAEAVKKNCNPASCGASTASAKTTAQKTEKASCQPAEKKSTAKKVL